MATASKPRPTPSSEDTYQIVDIVMNPTDHRQVLVLTRDGEIEARGRWAGRPAAVGAPVFEETAVKARRLVIGQWGNALSGYVVDTADNIHPFGGADDLAPVE